MGGYGGVFVAQDMTYFADPYGLNEVLYHG